MLKSLREYLGVGYLSKDRAAINLKVKSLSALKEVILPLFDKHPVYFGKLKAYFIFKEIVENMINKDHLKLEGLLRIVYLCKYLNADTGRRTPESYDNLLKYLESKHGKLTTPKELGIES